MNSGLSGLMGLGRALASSSKRKKKAVKLSKGARKVVATFLLGGRGRSGCRKDAGTGAQACAHWTDGRTLFVHHLPLATWGGMTSRGYKSEHQKDFVVVDPQKKIANETTQCAHLESNLTGSEGRLERLKLGRCRSTNIKVRQAVNELLKITKAGVSVRDRKSTVTRGGVRVFTGRKGEGRVVWDDFEPFHLEISSAMQRKASEYVNKVLHAEALRTSPRESAAAKKRLTAAKRKAAAAKRKAAKPKAKLKVKKAPAKRKKAAKRKKK